MRNIFYGVIAIGLLLFLQTSIYANPTPDCKPFVQIKSIKGNYIPQLNGNIETLEKFLLELAEQNANYCQISLKIDFKKGLKTKQTITHGKLKYNEKLYLEVQYFSPSYEVVIENSDGEILHEVELGKELKSIEYSNPIFDNHDALYAEWRQIRETNFTQLEKDENNFHALINFLKTENGMSSSENKSLAMNDAKEILVAKGEPQKLEEKENKTQPTQKKKRKKRRKDSKAKTKKKEIEKSITQSNQKRNTSKTESNNNSTSNEAKKELKGTEKNQTQLNQKNNRSKTENSTSNVVKEELKEIKKIKPQPNQKKNTSKTERVESKENKTIDSKENSISITSIERKKTNPSQPQKSSEPREIIADDDLFRSVDVIEPLAEMIRFDFPYGKKYKVINESDFSVKINTGRENGKIFDNNTLKPKQEKRVKNKFKSGDWYSVMYTEKLHEKDINNYKKDIKSILSDLKISEHENIFFKMSEQLIPNLDIITNENPLADHSQAKKVEVKFQEFINEKNIEVFKEDQQQEAATQLKSLLTLIIQSHQLFHYYKYTVGSSAPRRPVNQLPRFRKN